MTDFERFGAYDADELARCGARFVSLLRSEQHHLGHGPDLWADLVLNWFAHACTAAGVVVDTSAVRLERSEWAGRTSALSAALAVPPRQGTNEFLQIDLFASRSPGYLEENYWTAGYWDEVLASATIEPLLALEVEWKGKTAAGRAVYAMHSAVKLAWVRARAKVLVCASHENKRGGTGEIHGWLDRVEALRRKSSDTSPWLLIDVAYAREQWTEAHGPAAWVITDSGRKDV